jgi:hypothetical protein
MFRNIDESAQPDGTLRGRAEPEGGRLRADERLTHHAKASRPSLDELAFLIAVGFRQHGHIGNVLTHICRRDWAMLEQALRRIFDPQTVSADLSPLESNIVELLCANRGVTGRIARPYFQKMLNAILGPYGAARLVRQIDLIFAQIGRARSVGGSRLYEEDC